MTAAPKYSVIIPVYNAEATLHRCFDSLLSQQYRDMELIVVNDGSTDDSDVICREYAQRFPMFRYISKPNGGVSSARNTGLDAAAGTYVLFVDSDDYVSSDYFYALDSMGGLEYECILFSISLFDGDSESQRILTPFSSSDINACIPRFCEAMYRKYINEPFNKRYLRKIILDHNIRFPEEISIGEDKVFSLRYIMHCSSCLMSSKILYHVSLENKQSLSRARKSDLNQQLRKLTALTQKTIDEAQIPEEHRRQFQAAENLIQLRAVYSEAKRMHLSGSAYGTRKERIRDMCDQLNRHRKDLPKRLFTTVLVVPVRLRFTLFIDLVGRFLAR